MMDDSAVGYGCHRKPTKDLVNYKSTTAFTLRDGTEQMTLKCSSDNNSS